MGAGNRQREVIVLEAETRDILKRLKFHQDEVNAVKFTSCSQIASASSDNTIALWSWALSEPLNSDESKLFSASDDGTVKVWDLAGGNCTESFSMEGPA